MKLEKKFYEELEKFNKAMIADFEKAAEYKGHRLEGVDFDIEKIGFKILCHLAQCECSSEIAEFAPKAANYTFLLWLMRDGGITL